MQGSTGNGAPCLLGKAQPWHRDSVPSPWLPAPFLLLSPPLPGPRGEKNSSSQSARKALGAPCSLPAAHSLPCANCTFTAPPPPACPTGPQPHLGTPAANQTGAGRQTHWELACPMLGLLRASAASYCPSNTRGLRLCPSPVAPPQAYLQPFPLRFLWRLALHKHKGLIAGTPMNPKIGPRTGSVEGTKPARPMRPGSGQRSGSWEWREPFRRQGRC